MGSRTDLPAAEACAQDALVKALITFRPESTEEHPQTSDPRLLAWVCKMVRFALKTYAKNFRTRRVCSEYLRLLDERGYAPTLKELRRACKLSTRQLLAVWPAVASDLQIPSDTDSIVLGGFPAWAFATGEQHSGYIRPELDKCLLELDPKDASLLLMRYALEMREKSILDLVGSCRSRASDKEPCPMEPDFGSELSTPFRAMLHDGWRKGVLSIRSKSQLRARVHRAKWQLRKLLYLAQLTECPEPARN